MEVSFSFKETLDLKLIEELKLILGTETKEFQRPNVLIKPTKFPHFLFRNGDYIGDFFFFTIPGKNIFKNVRDAQRTKQIFPSLPLDRTVGDIVTTYS